MYTSAFLDYVGGVGPYWILFLLNMRKDIGAVVTVGYNSYSYSCWVGQTELASAIVKMLRPRDAT